MTARRVNSGWMTGYRLSTAPASFRSSMMKRSSPIPDDRSTISTRSIVLLGATYATKSSNRRVVFPLDIVGWVHQINAINNHDAGNECAIVRKFANVKLRGRVSRTNTIRSRCRPTSGRSRSSLSTLIGNCQRLSLILLPSSHYTRLEQTTATSQTKVRTK